ncbi:MAG: hypothetical protein HQM14_17580 [SAR324 cluster bacterium]|nr:hypothetical protein [SAR324 cluster bacterium]
MKERPHSTFVHHRLIHVSDLDRDERKWFASAIAGAIVSDSVVSPGQLSWIKNSLYFLSKKERLTYLKHIKNKSSPPLTSLPNIDRDKAAKIFLDLILVMMENFEIDTRETQFLVNAGKTLGIKEKRCMDVIRWAISLLDLFHEKERFVERIIRDEPNY